MDDPIPMKSTLTEHWAISLLRSFIRSQRSLICLLRAAHFVRALRCAHSLARTSHALAPELMGIRFFVYQLKCVDFISFQPHSAASDAPVETLIEGIAYLRTDCPPADSPCAKDNGLCPHFCFARQDGWKTCAEPDEEGIVNPVFKPDEAMPFVVDAAPSLFVDVKKLNFICLFIVFALGRK